MRRMGEMGFRENGESIECRVYEECRECMRCGDHEDYKILRVKSRDIKILRVKRVEDEVGYV